MMRIILILFCSIPLFLKAQNQSFYFGNDLSYVNQMEDCGAVYKENNVEKDPFTIFADHGTNLVRVRLWKDPSWWQSPISQPAGVKPFYNDFEDVKKTIKRARENGMEVMLDIPYSDFWADPGYQLIPRAWVGVAYDLEALKDSVYNYTVLILTELDKEGLMPNIVKIGNENNKGFLMDIPKEGSYEIKETVSTSWVRHAQLFNEAIRAVRDVGALASINPKVALHMTNGLSGLEWNYQNRFINNGVIDFDIIGFSYYYSWHGGSIAELESTVSNLKNTFDGYEVMAVETGYPWSKENFDALGNIVTTPDPEYLPLTPEKQLEYMIDYTRAVMKAGGNGVIFWEPAWISTPCRTPWGTGSSHDHLVFFDPENTNFMENGGGRWMESQWYENIEAVKVSFKVDMFNQDVSKGVYMNGNFTNEPILLNDELNNIFYHYTYLPSGTNGTYYFQNGTDILNRETVPQVCVEAGGNDRPFTVPNNKVVFDYLWSSCEASDPERQFFHNVTFRVDLSGHDKGEGAFITGSFTGDPWKTLPMTHEGGNTYSYTILSKEGRTGAFHFLNSKILTDSRESVPSECAPWWGTDRGYEVGNQDRTYSFAYGSCDQNMVLGLTEEENAIRVYSDPVSKIIILNIPSGIESISIYALDGKEILKKSIPTGVQSERISNEMFKSGIYIVVATGSLNWFTSKFIINNP